MASFERSVAQRTFSGEAMLDRLWQCRDMGISAFAKVADRLGATHAAGNALSGQLQAMGECLSDPGIGVDPLEDVAVAVRDLSEILQGWAQGGEHAELGQAYRQGQGALTVLHRESIKLQAVAAITLINSQSIGGVDLSDYVKSLRAMATELQQGAEAVSSGLRRISAAQEEAANTAGQAGQTLHTMDADLNTRRAARATENAQQSEGRRKMEEMAARVGRAARAEVQVLVTGIQFSDFYAQRLEHICQLLPMAKGAGAGSINGLVAAQIRALAGDADQIVADVCLALQHIKDLGDETGAVFEGGHRDGATQAHLDLRRGALERAIQSKRIVEPAILAANQSAALVRTDIEAAVSRFAGLIKTTEAMTLSAFNAGLLTSRGGTARTALSVLALAVHESVDACGREIKRCRAALAVIGAAEGTGHSGQIEQAADDFSRRVDDCSAAMIAMERLLRRIGDLRTETISTGADLRVATDSTLAEVVYVLDASKVLRDLALEIEDQATPGGGRQPDDAALNAAFEIYTMEREREVHEALFGAPTGAAARNVGTMAASLDDILF